MKIFHNSMDIMTVLRHWGRNHIWLFGRIELYFLGVDQVLDFVLKSPTVVGIMPYTVRVVSTLCIRVVIRGQLEWFYQLEGVNVRNWEDLAAAFYKKYQYNANLAPTHTQLQGMSMGVSEGFKDYAQK